MGKAVPRSEISPVGATRQTRLRVVAAKVGEKAKVVIIIPEGNRQVQKVKTPLRRRLFFNSQVKT